MGEACSTYGEKRPLVGKPEGKRYMEDLTIDGRIILKGFFEIGWVGGNLISLTQVRDTWRTVVNTAMNNHINQHST